MNWRGDALDSPGGFATAAAASGKASAAGCVPFGEGGDVWWDVGCVFTQAAFLLVCFGAGMSQMCPSVG